MPETRLRYFGHSSWQWTTPSGLRILIDPFHNGPGSDWFLREFPDVETDLLLVTHAHFDHDAMDRVKGRPTVVRDPVRMNMVDASIDGVLDQHAPGRGNSIIPNTMFVIETGAVRFCHLGDNRADFATDAEATLGRPDVLFVPVDDSGHVLSHDEANAVVRRLRPRVVIPVHYYIKGLTTKESTLQSPEGWLAKQSRVRRFDTDTITFATDRLPDELEIWVPSAALV